MIKIEGFRKVEFNVKKTNQLDSDGFLTIEGVASVADKPLEYIDWWTLDITKEVIPLEELEKAKDSIVGVPVTNGHPWEFVNSKNATEHTKGMVFESLGIVNKELSIRAKILDSNLITDILSGKDKISTGYYCDMEKTAGVTESGEIYTHIQRNLRWNHMGIVDDPREEEARITKFNSNEHDLAYSTALKEQFKKINEKGSGQMAVWKINGKDFTEQELFAEATRLNSENATLLSEKSNLEGQLAVEKNNSQEATKKLNGMEEEIQKRVNSRLELFTEIKANGIEIEGIEKMNEADIKKAVIKKNSTIDIEGKDENFIEGVYSALMKNNAKDPIVAAATAGAGAGTQETKTNSIGNAWETLRKGGKQ